MLLTSLIEFLITLPSAAYMLVGALFTAAITGGVKFATDMRGDNRDDRNSYAKEIEDLKHRLDKVEAEVTRWRIRYYKEQEYSYRLRVQLLQAGHEPDGRTPDQRWTAGDNEGVKDD